MNLDLNEPASQYEEQSSSSFTHSNAGGFQPWTQQDSTHGQSSNPRFNHSEKKGAFSYWRKGRN